MRGILSAILAVTLTTYLKPHDEPAHSRISLPTNETYQLAGVNPVLSSPGRDNWALSFEDTFDGDTLDTSKWTVRRGDKRYDPSFVRVSGGNLNLKIDRNTQGQIRAARIDTTGTSRGDKNKWDQQYGFFEVRAQVPPTDQTIFAFWLQSYPGVNRVDGTGHDGCEIDVVESMFTSDTIQPTLHFDGYGAKHKSVSSPRIPAPNLHDGFHVFGLEWTTEELKFYYDGAHIWTYKGVAVPQVKEFIILSTETGFGEGNLANAKLPYVARVDYIRAWRKILRSTASADIDGLRQAAAISRRHHPRRSAFSRVAT